MLSSDAKSLKSMGKALRQSQPSMYRELQKALRAEGDLIRRRAASNASSFSKNIPATGKVRAAGTSAVTVSFGGAQAPYAKALENHGKGHVRHPVFGNKQNWTDKNSPPAFLLPAATARLSESAKAVGDALQVQVEKVIHGQEMFV